MSTSTHLSKDKLRHLMNLAKLELDEHELVEIGKQLNETLDYFENLNDLYISAISESAYITKATNVFRDDEVDKKRLLNQSEISSNAKKKKNNFFVVSRIL